MKQKPKEKSEKKSSKSEELREQIENLQKEKDELFEKLQRVSADYANYQKRIPKQLSDNITYQKEKLIKTLLPILDNFEHTLQNAHSAENVEDVVKGVRIVYDQMLDVLKSHEVEQLQADGEKFDPSMHEAMMQRPEPDKEEGIVLEVFQKGYKLNERILRPSKVIVNKLPTEQSDKPENEDPEEVVE
ncbi:MAG: nucleotide exchange factor GrpE [Planctomycetota bacterium]|jgi:molecular chaperone GrpE